MVQVGPKSLAQDTAKTALDALWAVYGSVRGCIRGHSDLGVVVQQRNGSDWVSRVREAQDKSCNVRWTGNQDFEQFDAIRSQDCIRSVIQVANNKETSSVRDGNTCRQDAAEGTEWLQVA
jgi:hypothetical protein